MDITMFLAHIWGPIMLAIGAGMFVSKKFYVRIYRELEKDSLAVLTFGCTAMTLGILHVGAHNVWGTFPQAIVSLLGWGLLLKGTVFVVAPKLADMGGDIAADSKLVPAAGGALLLLGAYLSWIAYLA
jgi:hypothetical protein